MRWKHPSLFITEIKHSATSPIYEASLKHPLSLFCVLCVKDKHSATRKSGECAQALCITCQENTILVQDAQIAIIALHASPTGWEAPEWLTQLGSKSFDAPKTLAASNDDACHTSGSMCSSSSSDEDLVSADSSSAASDSSSEDVDAPQERLESADGGPEASSATMDQPAAGAYNPAFQELDQLLMLHSTRQSIFQVH